MDDVKVKIVDLGDASEMNMEHRQVRKMILTEMASFEGYPAFGIFNIKNSLLTDVVANFITYFIILVQFRMIE